MKRAQVKMGETIAILFIFFVLILFGLIFYFQFQKSSFERQKVELFSEQSISKSLVASFLPELICSRNVAATVKNCIDLKKLEFASEEMKDNREYYFDIFGFAVITVEEIYPGNGTWVLYNQTPPEITREINTPIPVSLFNPVENTYSFGALNVEVYT
ncbi:MAG: hypothetical protein KAT77_02160 [Nanoarchaeota archaeon]|nr:hypothetical protein [Nanoarchaeota archaeon]